MCAELTHYYGDPLEEVVNATLNRFATQINERLGEIENKVAFQETKTFTKTGTLFLLMIL